LPRYRATARLLAGPRWPLGHAARARCRYRYRTHAPRVAGRVGRWAALLLRCCCRARSAAAAALLAAALGPLALAGRIARPRSRAARSRPPLLGRVRCWAIALGRARCCATAGLRRTVWAANEDSFSYFQ